ncbi:portal protein, partial [Erwinia amylovora]|uniref:portal protein n=1 Tax=Erwinia amylovora TaxID=552 RepID=UPI0020C08A5E
LYLQNNGRYGIDVNTVNVDDMLVSRPGGIVRTDGPPGAGIFPFTHPALGQSALEGMNWATQWRQTSTGVFMDSSNMSPDVLNNA